MKRIRFIISHNEFQKLKPSEKTQETYHIASYNSKCIVCSCQIRKGDSIARFDKFNVHSECAGALIEYSKTK
jgi:hypothetical protein